KRLDDLRKNAPLEAPKPATMAATPEAKAAADVEENFALRFKDKDGKAGVDVARRLRELKEVEQAGSPSAAAFRKAAGTRFVLYRGLWVDERFDAAATVTSVKFGSDAYFRLLEKTPALVDAFKLGTDVVY